MPYLAETLAEFAVTSGAATVPAELARELENKAKLHVLDAIGIAIACSTASDGYGDAVAAVCDEAGNGGASAVGFQKRMTVAHAALYNGSLVHGSEQDDTFFDRIVHTESVSVPTILAVAEAEGRSGADAIDAWLVGTEIAVRLSLGTEDGLASSGLHNSPWFGIFGAAASASRLYRLDADQTATAMSLALSFASGTNAGWSTGSGRNKCVQPGWAAMSGIMAAQMARAGFDCPHDTLDSDGEGFLPARTNGNWSRDRVLADLGQHWRALDLAFKIHPAGSMVQAAIDAALTVVTEHDVRPEEVLRVRIEIPSQYERPFRRYNDLRRPTSGMLHAGSWPCNVARIILDRHISIQDLEPERIAQPELLRLAELTDCVIADDTHLAVLDRPTIVTIETARGVFTEARVENSGHPKNLRDEIIHEKFRENTARNLSPDAAGELERTVMGLENLENLDPVTALLRFDKAALTARTP